MTSADPDSGRADGHTLTLPWVETATTGFVYAQRMREAVSLALVSGLNVLFSGPGGHGKSEFLTAVFAAIQGVEPYVKSFGQGTTAEELYGGLDLEALNRESGAVIQYHAENSFLRFPLAIFEELFDAPARMLTFLKDTLTARELRNGVQRVPMLTSVVAVATNHSPQQVAEAGPAVAALVERFPIQLEVRWDAYDDVAFFHLLETVDADRQQADEHVSWCDIERLQLETWEVTATRLTKRVLAGVLVELRREGVTVSPRTAVMALRLVRAAAVINGRSETLPVDVRAVGYLPGCQDKTERIVELLQEAEATFGAAIALEDAELELDDMQRCWTAARYPHDFVQLHARLVAMDSVLNSIRVDSALGFRMNNALNDCQGLYSQVTSRLEDFRQGLSMPMAQSLIDDLKGRLDLISQALQLPHDSTEAQRQRMLLGIVHQQAEGLTVPAALQSQLDRIIRTTITLIVRCDSDDPHPGALTNGRR